LSTKKKQEEIMIDTEGRLIEDNVPPSTTTLMSASNNPASSDNNRSNDLLDFELSLPFKEVWRVAAAIAQSRLSKWNLL
jgi:hypothetical protein